MVKRAPPSGASPTLTSPPCSVGDLADDGQSEAGAARCCGRGGSARRCAGARRARRRGRCRRPRGCRRPGAVLSEQRTMPPAGAWRIALATRLQTTETSFSSSTTAGRRSGTAEAQVEAALRGELAEALDAAAHDRGDVDDGGLELQVGGLQPGDEHQVLDAAQHRVGVRADPRDVLGVLASSRPASSSRPQSASMIDSGDFSSWPTSASSWRGSPSSRARSACRSGSRAPARARHQR